VPRGDAAGAVLVRQARRGVLAFCTYPGLTTVFAVAMVVAGGHLLEDPRQGYSPALLLFLW